MVIGTLWIHYKEQKEHGWNFCLMMRPWKGHIYNLFCMSNIAHYLNWILLYLIQCIHSTLFFSVFVIWPNYHFILNEKNAFITGHITLLSCFYDIMHLCKKKVGITKTERKWTKLPHFISETVQVVKAENYSMSQRSFGGTKKKRLKNRNQIQVFVKKTRYDFFRHLGLKPFLKGPGGKKHVGQHLL